MPKKYVEKVGEDGFKKAPIGAGPYKFVSFTPGVELVLEAYEGYWRKPPSVKRLVLKVIPDEATRLAALKRGEVDIAYSIRGELAEELRRTPGLRAEADGDPVAVLAVFRRTVGPEVAVARRCACGRPRVWRIDRKTINQALTLGYSLFTGSMIPEISNSTGSRRSRCTIRNRRDSCWPRPGFPNGFDAGLL